MMNKETIKKELAEKHKDFTDYVNSLSDTDFLQKKNNEKWSAGEQLEHIYLSVQPLSLVFKIPKIILKIIYGKPKQKRSYEEIVRIYQEILKNGGKAGKSYIPKVVSKEQKQKLVMELNNLINYLTQKIDKLREGDLDNILLPHPLIGKISLREMLYFTIYHVQHHHKLVKDR
jgi:hypothetical protein